jgi:hypothetical protein
MTYAGYMKALIEGRSYVSDGSSHIIDFKVNGTEPGLNNSEITLSAGKAIEVSAKVIANLQAKQTEEGATIAHRSMSDQPYWNLERARKGTSRDVAVELVVNGTPVETAAITADGSWKDVKFKHILMESGWIALRIYPSVHTNPVFAIVDGKPIRVNKSAEWCRKAVDQCWKMKQNNIRAGERAAAEKAYNHAREVYDKIIRESK